MRVRHGNLLSGDVGERVYAANSCFLEGERVKVNQTVNSASLETPI